MRGNHDLGVTDTLPSVCASLTKAMVVVHCICTCDRPSLLNFGILYLIASYQEIFKSIPIEDKLATHETNSISLHNTHISLCHSAQQSSIPEI